MSNTDRFRFRVIAPAYPALSIYSRIAKTTTALGPVVVATTASRLPSWDVEIIDENNYVHPGPKNAKGHPDHETLQAIRKADVVGIYGGLSSTIPRLYDLAAFYKESGATTIAGGQHFVGEHIKDALHSGLDYIALGEAEETVRELLMALQNGEDPQQVAGIAFLRDGEVVQTPDRTLTKDFDRLPLPNFDLVRYARIKIYPVNWIRGCGSNCEFCTVKGKPRLASAERVVEQIASLVESHKAEHFFLVDDLFGQFRKETLRLCHLLSVYQKAIETRLDITVQIRLDRAKDAELLAAMRQANINTVCIGFESPIPEELEAMNKKVHPEEMVHLARQYHEAGFLVHGMFIFGYPLPEGVEFHQSIDERVKHFKRFIRKARLDTIQVLLPVPLPGTELTRRMESQGRVFSRDIIGWQYYDGNFPLINPDAPLTAEEVHAGIRKIMGRFYRFRYMFVIGLNVLLFPSMVFAVFKPKSGWRRWYRSWRNALKRFGGWVALRNWTAAMRQGGFEKKLDEASRDVQAEKEPAQDAHVPEEEAPHRAV